MRSPVILGFITGMALTLTVAGCSKKSGKAVVLEKEHIAAREIVATPATEQASTPGEVTASSPEPTPRVEAAPELAEDEIAVDTYVMKKDARGTSRDPRATTDEQWIVQVQMVAGLRRIKVQTDKAHWDKIKIGDQINVSYREGNYTGTVWAAEIE
jgi:hypothetical protein